VVVFSFIVLALSAHVTNLTTNFYGVYFTFAALSIATAILSLISLPAMYFRRVFFDKKYPHRNYLGLSLTAYAKGRSRP
jgi:hypothetical protein